MSLNLTGILDALESDIGALGHFRAINRHEPKNAPPANVLTAALWVQRIGPLPSASGLASTTTRIEFTLRVFQGMLTEPQDAIDPTVMAAVDAVVTALSGDFTLGGLIRQIDCLGQFGIPLGGQAGYLNQDGTLFRVFDVTIPCVVNDLYAQAE